MPRILHVVVVVVMLVQNDDTGDICTVKILLRRTPLKIWSVSLKSFFLVAFLCYVANSTVDNLCASTIKSLAMFRINLFVACAMTVAVFFLS